MTNPTPEQIQQAIEHCALRLTPELLAESNHQATVWVGQLSILIAAAKIGSSLITHHSSLAKVAAHLGTQDNRATAHPMFCVQILVREVGFDIAYADNRCWWNPEELRAIYDDDKRFRGEPKRKGWDGPYGYKDRWETVMVALTEAGCNEYLELDGHNVKRRAFRGQIRIYAESFNRCHEMIAIREFLLSIGRAEVPFRPD